MVSCSRDQKLKTSIEHDAIIPARWEEFYDFVGFVVVVFSLIPGLPHISSLGSLSRRQAKFGPFARLFLDEFELNRYFFS